MSRYFQPKSERHSMTINQSSTVSRKAAEAYGNRRMHQPVGQDPPRDQIRDPDIARRREQHTDQRQRHRQRGQDIECDRVEQRQNADRRQRGS